jgi:hypothetical protein
MSDLVPHGDVPDDESALLDYVAEIIYRRRRAAAV